MKLLRRLFSLRRPKARTVRLQAEGECHHLNEIYDRVNQRYFEGKLDLKISWFGSHDSKAKRRLVLGSYNQQKGLVRINRVLDKAHVPDHFVSFIVYHEMLHHVLPPLKRSRERRRIHHSAFSAREKQFESYSEAVEFKKTFVSKFFSRDLL